MPEHDTSSRSDMHASNYNMSQRVSELLNAPLLSLPRGDNPKEQQGEQPFLHETHYLDLICMYNKYHQNISKGKRVIERTSFSL